MKYLVLVLLFGCIAQPVPTEALPPVVIVPAPEVVIVPGKAWKTPLYVLPSRPSIAMLEAVSLIKQYANTDEFYNYIRTSVKTLAGGNETNLETAITKFRTCLDKNETIKITWYNYRPFSNVIGGWTGYEIVQNPKIGMTAIERAGHWLHENSHACGFTHISNNISRYPIIKESWPYVVGYQFQYFLKIKQLNKVAVE